MKSLNENDKLVKLIKDIKRNKILYVLILPVMIYFAVFTFYPLLKGVIISFQHYGLIGSTGFSGLENYIKVLKDPYFLQSILNTLIISSGILVIGFTFPMAVAISLSELKGKPFQRLSQTIVYVPHLLSWVIIIGIWINILSTNGLVNQFLLKVGLIANPISFFGEPKFARSLVVSMTIWKDMGYTSIIYLASIMSVNPSLYEAAEIDGAGVLQKIRSVTLPHLVPTMKVVFLITLMGVLRTFDSVYIMSNGAIGHKINTAIMYTYEKGILRFDLGVSTAAAMVLFLITILLTMSIKKIMKLS